MPAPSVSKDELGAVFSELTNFGSPLVGGQAAVFPCEHKGKKVALKVIGAVLDDQSEDFEQSHMASEFLRARREIEVLGKIDSPNLIKLGPVAPKSFNHGNQSILAFSLEWVDGSSMKQLWRRNPPVFTYRDLIQLGQEITKVIGELSSQGFLHRDITLGNIMRRQQDNSFILLDMGLSFDFSSSSLSQSGAIVGTRGFIAPERLEVSRKRKVSFKSDCYSLGVVMYACATGELPFAANAAMTKRDLADILNRTPKPINQTDSGFPRELESFIMRLLSPAPHMRFPTIEEQLASLEKALTKLEESAW